MFKTRLYNSAEIKVSGDMKLGIVAVMRDGKRIHMNSIPALRFYRRIAVGWETPNGKVMSPEVVAKTLKNFSNGIHQ